jgi:hypothetical protein
MLLFISVNNFGAPVLRQWPYRLFYLLTDITTSYGRINPLGRALRFSSSIDKKKYKSWGGRKMAD